MNGEEEVYGDPNASFKDYDIATLQSRYDFTLRTNLFYQMRAGEKLLESESHDILLCWQNKVVPMFVKYHHGPFQRLSDYTREINVVSIGKDCIY